MLNDFYEGNLPVDPPTEDAGSVDLDADRPRQRLSIDRDSDIGESDEDNAEPRAVSSSPLAHYYRNILTDDQSTSKAKGKQKDATIPLAFRHPKMLVPSDTATVEDCLDIVHTNISNLGGFMGMQLRHCGKAMAGVLQDMGTELTKAIHAASISGRESEVERA